METPEVEFYWRPGCPFCMMLEQGLKSKKIPFVKKNIWEKASYAEFVRSVADGNETVPTVRIGDEAKVNPSAKEVKKWVSRVAPELLT